MPADKIYTNSIFLNDFELRLGDWHVPLWAETGLFKFITTGSYQYQSSDIEMTLYMLTFQET